MLDLNKIYNIDCLTGMTQIADKSIDMIFVDLPYGVTAHNKWDSVIPFEPMGNSLNVSLKTMERFFFSGRINSRQS